MSGVRFPLCPFFQFELNQNHPKTRENPVFSRVFCLAGFASFSRFACLRGHWWGHSEQFCCRVDDCGRRSVQWTWGAKCLQRGYAIRSSNIRNKRTPNKVNATPAIVVTVLLLRRGSGLLSVPGDWYGLSVIVLWSSIRQKYVCRFRLWCGS